MKSENLIIGCGSAGLVSLFYLDQFEAVDNNPLGELSHKYQLGPRLLQKDPLTLRFIVDVLAKSHSSYAIKTDLTKIGYQYDEFENDIYDYATERFKKQYSKITRNKTEYEKSFMSESKNFIENYVLYDGENKIEDSYKKVFELVYSLVKDRVIDTKVTSIHKDLTVELAAWPHPQKQRYKNVISTIPFPKLLSLFNINEENKYETIKKNFYVCSYDNEYEKNISKKYSYVYSINRKYTRKTYFKDYITYESVKKINSKHIDKNKIIFSVLDLPIQIKNSSNMNKFNNITLIGRYAQWNHSVKLQDVIKRVIECKTSF
jgi:hypothetical protein